MGQEVGRVRTVILWHPDAKIVRPNNRSGGTFIGAKWKVVLHSTEGGGNWDGAVSYHGSQSYPHFEVGGGLPITQFLPIDRAAYALYNGAEAGQTNNANIIQIEIRGYAKDAPNFTAATLADIASIIRFVHEQTGMAIAFPLPFRPPFTAGLRYTGKAFHDLEGVIGHQHVGDGNDHTDPGQIDVLALKALLNVPTPDKLPEETPDMLIFDYNGPGKETGVWITDGLTRRPTNAPAKYLAAGVKHMGELTVGEFNELVDVRTLVAKVDAAEYAVNVAKAVIAALPDSFDLDLRDVADYVVEAFATKLAK